jgi:hypothetical protein
VAKTDAGEALVGEQDRDTLSRAAPSDDDLGVGDVVDVGIRLPWRQRVARLCAVADRLEGRPVEPRPPAVGEDRARLCVCAFGQDTRLAGSGRPPSLAESGRNLGTLPLKFWIAVQAGCHDEMVVQSLSTPRKQQAFVSLGQPAGKDPAVSGGPRR